MRNLAPALTERGFGAAMITPAANTECMNLHLTEISIQVSPGAAAVVVCDGAGWHQSGGELAVPDKIVLLHLPHYCPELNPMENVRTTYAPINSVPPFGTAMTRFWRRAGKLGSSSSMTLIVSGQSGPPIGQRSMSRAVDVI